MGQKVNPIANRLGYIRGWDSNWYASATDFPDKLYEDEKIREYLHARINKGGMSRIIIERTLKRITVTINTSRPGIIIGKGGSEVDRIREELKTEKSIIHAFDSGYSKAKITVLDANITTLIAAIILFAFGSGPVKGFAITLGIGILTTLFTAYFLARHLTSMIILRKKNITLRI